MLAGGMLENGYRECTSATWTDATTTPREPRASSERIADPCLDFEVQATLKTFAMLYSRSTASGERSRQCATMCDMQQRSIHFFVKHHEWQPWGPPSVLCQPTIEKSAAKPSILPGTILHSLWQSSVTLALPLALQSVPPTIKYENRMLCS